MELLFAQFDDLPRINSINRISPCHVAWDCRAQYIFPFAVPLQYPHISSLVYQDKATRQARDDSVCSVSKSKMVNLKQKFNKLFKSDVSLFPCISSPILSFHTNGLTARLAILAAGR